VSDSGRIALLLGEMAALGVLGTLGGAGQAVVDGKSAGQGSGQPDVELREGGIVRGPASARRLAFVFTGHEFAEGGEVILNELRKHKGKGAFFLTGDFLTNSGFQPLIERMVKEAHYLGPHSIKHVLYCPWEGPKKTLVTHAEFQADLESNLGKIGRFGVPRAQIRYFLPPYEYYNQEIVDWAKAMGLTLVNFTPGHARERGLYGRSGEELRLLTGHFRQHCRPGAKERQRLEWVHPGAAHRVRAGTGGQVRRAVRGIARPTRGQGLPVRPGG
jgi:hypothetical protein